MGGRRLCDVPSVGGGKGYFYCFLARFFSNVYLLCFFFGIQCFSQWQPGTFPNRAEVILQLFRVRETYTKDVLAVKLCTWDSEVLGSFCLQKMYLFNLHHFHVEICCKPLVTSHLRDMFCPFFRSFF